MICITVSNDDFDTGAELARLETLGGGAVASFTGIVRGEPGSALTLDHYPEMTEAALLTLAQTAIARWTLKGVTIIHRVGVLPAGARIVLVATAADHRAPALEACSFLIDRLKTDAPFWKKERGTDGSERWVDARESDDVAAAFWNK